MNVSIDEKLKTDRVPYRDATNDDIGEMIHVVIKLIKERVSLWTKLAFQFDGSFFYSSCQMSWKHLMIVGIVNPEIHDANINAFIDPLLCPIISELIAKQSEANIINNRCPMYLMANGRKMFHTPVIM